MKILLSAYRCNPYDISEAYLAFKWLEILLKKYEIILLTTTENSESLHQYFQDNFPHNLKIYTFEDSYPFKKNRIVKNALKLGYFIFNEKIYRFLRRNPQIVEHADLLFHKSPSSFRFYSSLSRFKKPFVIGPYGGGLKPPRELKKYFNKEPFLYKLRSLDQLILRFGPVKKQLNQTHRILITLDYLRDIIPEKYNTKTLQVLDTGITCSTFNRKNGYPQNKVRILFVGRLTRYKGVEFLVKAFAKIHLNTPNAQLVLVGDGEERNYLEELTSQLRIQNKVRFLGHLEREGVIREFNTASLFCFPSITESIGIVLLEAMSFALPIITIGNGGPQYLCPDEGAIKLQLSNEETLIQNLAGSLKRLIENPILRQEMGRFNRQYCLENYDWEIIEKKILDIFDKILA